MTTPITIIHQMELGPMQNFIYVVVDSTTKTCVVIDPAWDVDAIRKHVRKMGCRITAVLIPFRINILQNSPFTKA